MSLNLPLDPVEESLWAADVRRLTPISRVFSSALIGVHRRPFFFSHVLIERSPHCRLLPAAHFRRGRRGLFDGGLAVALFPLVQQFLFRHGAEPFVSAP